MKKIKLTLTTGSTEDFFKRARNRAEKLDRGEILPAGITINFEDPMELLSVLTSERMRLLGRIKGKSQLMSALADELQRDLRAVSRDVSHLEKVGLVRTSYIANPGHGRLKVVEPIAQNYRLVADF